MAAKFSTIKPSPYIFLRKKRKWPRSPYKTKWHYNFNQQQSLLSLQKSANLQQQQQQNPPFILTSLINSFNSYNCKPTPNAYDFIIKTLIKKSQFNDLDFVLTHLKKVESFDSPEYIFVDLIRVYGENGMVEEAIKLFFDIPQYRCVPTVLSLNSLLLVLCRSREDCLRLVPQLILKSGYMGVRIEESSFFILINALCKIGKFGFAIKLLNYMIAHESFDPDEKFYSLILSSLCKQKDGDKRSIEVVGVFEDMKRVGFCPGREDFRNLVKVLAKNGRGNDAFGVLSDMKREGYKPDIVCYTMVMYGLVEKGEFLRVDELFDEVLLFGLVPHLRTYNVYISGLCKQKKVEDAYRMIGYMEELGCLANSVTYCTVLEGFCKVGSLGRVRDVWTEMKQKGMVSSAEAYRIVIDALVNGGELLEASTVLEEMLSHSFTPVSSTLDGIVCSLCQKGLLVKALDILHRLVNHDVVPGFKSWEALLRVLNLDLDYVKAELAILVNLPEE